MKVKCINIILDGKKMQKFGDTNGILTVGKIYIVLSVSMSKRGLRLRIECDEGELRLPDANAFEILTNYIPSNWVIKFVTEDSNSYYLKLAPLKWEEALFNIGAPNEQGFYEEIDNVSSPLENWRQYPPERIPEVVKLYFQEKDIIYKEEEAYEKVGAAGFSKPSSLLLNLIKGGK